MGLRSKISSERRRFSAIHSGSPLTLESSLTTSREMPWRARSWPCSSSTIGLGLLILVLSIVAIGCSLQVSSRILSCEVGILSLAAARPLGRLPGGVSHSCDRELPANRRSQTRRTPAVAQRRRSASCRPRMVAGDRASHDLQVEQGALAPRRRNRDPEQLE